MIYSLLGVLISSLILTSCTRTNRGAENTLTVVTGVGQQGGQNIKGLDPALANDVYAGLVVLQIYEGLLHYHFLKRPLQVEPLLAAEMPKVSQDGLTHTFKIRPGLKFHDDPSFPGGKGREVTSEDFIYSWKRIADAANQSDGFWIFDGKIVGLNEWRDKIGKGEATYDTPIDGLQAPDKSTLVIKLTRPYFQLHYVLTMPYAVVVPKEAVDKYGKEFLNHPVGTGPFKFESWTRNSQVVLLRNPDWNIETYPSEGEATDSANGFLADAGKKIPFVDKLVIREIVEDQPRWLNFMKGDIDFLTIPKDNFDAAVKNDQVSEELKAKGISLAIARDADVTYAGFNMMDPLIGKNENLRKAIALAHDSETYIKKFYNGRAIVAQSPIPPDVDAYDAAFKSPYSEFNVAKAKEYLRKAGFPDGKGAATLEYATTNSSTQRQTAEFFKQCMEKIGLKIKITTSTWPQFTDKLKEKKAQMFGIAWLADYPDAENFLQLLYGKNISPGPNSANYKNKEFDDLYEKASRMPPGAERTKAYRAMRDIIVRDMPWVPVAHRLSYTTYHSWLKNFKYHTMIMDNLKYFRVDTKARGETKAKL
jgi:oligopeptide transport system substrate-binding protein